MLQTIAIEALSTSSGIPKNGSPLDTQTASTRNEYSLFVVASDVTRHRLGRQV
jgi:hypothetical protein